MIRSLWGCVCFLMQKLLTLGALLLSACGTAAHHSDDAGPELDAGPSSDVGLALDASTPDASPDAGLPGEQCSPSELEAVSAFVTRAGYPSGIMGSRTGPVAGTILTTRTPTITEITIADETVTFRWTGTDKNPFRVGEKVTVYDATGWDAVRSDTATIATLTAAAFVAPTELPSLQLDGDILLTASFDEPACSFSDTFAAERCGLGPRPGYSLGLNISDSAGHSATLAPTEEAVLGTWSAKHYGSVQLPHYGRAGGDGLQCIVEALFKMEVVAVEYR